MTVFRKEILEEIRNRINTLGLTACPVCGSEDRMQVSRIPVVMHIGGHFERHEPDADPTVNILFYVQVVCDLCGHAMFFDSEKFHSGDEPVLEIPPE